MSGFSVVQLVVSVSNRWLEQVAARINRNDTEDGHISLLMHDLQHYLDEGQSTGALQVNLKARPLLLVLDMGLEQTALALVRGGRTLGVQAQAIASIGGAAFEAALVAWVQSFFTSLNPTLNDKLEARRYLPSAQRILTLICQGAPFGELEETIIIDSRPFTVALPLVREELVSVFRPLLGPDGAFLLALRKFMTDKNQTVESIDHIICFGVFSRLPLFREALADTFSCKVLLPERLPTMSLAHKFRERLEVDKLERFETADPWKKKNNQRSINIVVKSVEKTRAVVAPHKVVTPTIVAPTKTVIQSKDTSLNNRDVDKTFIVTRQSGTSISNVKCPNCSEILYVPPYGNLVITCSKCKIKYRVKDR